MLPGIYSLIFVSQALANGDGSHAPDEMHNDVATVDPMLIVIPVVVILGGIIIWKVMFSKRKTPPVQTPSAQPDKTPPAEEKTVSQSGESDSSQKNG
jgi:hypothetical protein